MDTKTVRMDAKSAKKRRWQVCADPPFSRYMPEERIELSHPCGYWILSPARLPVPPLRLRSDSNQALWRVSRKMRGLRAISGHWIPDKDRSTRHSAQASSIQNRLDTCFQIGYTNIIAAELKLDFGRASIRGCSSVGRALEWHSRGPGFDSP